MGEFIVSPGEIIKEYLDDRDLSQKDVAQRIGVSEKHLSNLLNGKTRLTEEMSLKFEKLMPEIPASFWLNYEVKYQEYLAREKELVDLESQDLKEIAKQFHFKEVFGRTSMTLVEQAAAMLKLLGVSSFDRYRYACAGDFEFMQDSGEPESVVVCVKLCEEEAEEQNKDLSQIPYNKDKLIESLPRLKNIALNTEMDGSLKSCRKLLNRVGIYLVVLPEITNAKVRGALTTYRGHPAIFISERYKTHDHVWFTILHELGHLILHYDSKRTIISTEELASDAHKDQEANEYARSFFVNEDAYDAFISARKFTRGCIVDFAAEQGVDPGVIVGFLQHDKLLEFGKLNDFKTYC